MTNHYKDIQELNYKWMTPDQFECFTMLCDLMRGYHHVSGNIKPCGSGIEINTRATGWATFDFNHLTTAVVMAHKRSIRFEIEPSGPRMLKLCLHKRQRTGLMHERHPTLEQAMEAIG